MIKQLLISVLQIINVIIMTGVVTCFVVFPFILLGKLFS
jgi:hypothetical protein